MERITVEEALELIPLKENYSDKSLDAAAYYTLSPSSMGDGWENVTYYTAIESFLITDSQFITF